jgi:hypothetical protein
LCRRFFSEATDEFLPLSCNETQLAQLRGRHEGSPQQPGARAHREPLRIGHISLASRHPLDVPGIDHLGANAHGLQRRVRALPVNAGTLHHHFLGTKRGRPLGQLPAIAFERPELPVLDARRAIGFLDQRTRRNRRLGHVQADDALVESYQFHDSSFH